jgi:hypothetical protein
MGRGEACKQASRDFGRARPPLRLRCLWRRDPFQGLARLSHARLLTGMYFVIYSPGAILHGCSLRRRDRALSGATAACHVLLALAILPTQSSKMQSPSNAHGLGLMLKRWSPKEMQGPTHRPGESTKAVGVMAAQGRSRWRHHICVSDSMCMREASSRLVRITLHKCGCTQGLVDKTTNERSPRPAVDNEDRYQRRALQYALKILVDIN